MDFNNMKLEVGKVEEHLARFLDRETVIPDSCRVAASAEIFGDVVLGEDCSVWPKVVLRADIQSIRVGRGTNLQDGVIIHLADELGTEVGEFCTVGHGALLHACRIGDGCLIGMRATILDGAEIGAGSLVGANSLVTQRTVVPPGSLVLGSPAKVVRALTADEVAGLRSMADKYMAVSAGFVRRGIGLLSGSAWKERLS